MLCAHCLRYQKIIMANFASRLVVMGKNMLCSVEDLAPNVVFDRITFDQNILAKPRQFVLILAGFGAPNNARMALWGLVKIDISLS